MKTRFSMVPLQRAALPVFRPEVPAPGKVYRQIGVRLWGAGAYEREPIDGARTRYSSLSRVETSDIIVNKIWARNGSVAVVPENLAGCYGSNEFPTFAPIREILDPGWFHWITKTKPFWEQCDEKSRGTSGKNRIRPERFLEIEIPLPPLEEQQRVVVRIQELAAKIDEARSLKRQIESQARRLLLGVFYDQIKGADRRPMKEVAPTIRRSVTVDPDGSYPELGIRSFGKGTFHKPALSGIIVGSKRLYRIEPGDLIFNNVFAWEGAVAVARPEDAGRFGSHRFITCVVKDEVITARLLYFYFLTDEGLHQLGEASPGGAGRNRTLGLDALEEIHVPVPAYGRQLWFDDLQGKVETALQLQAEAAAELNALLPSILDRAFKGEL